MDHFAIFPVNENGVFWQPDKVGPAIAHAMSSPPFSFKDVFVYSHGWWTVANQAMVQYGEFSIEFTKNLIEGGCQLSSPPKETFGLGIHWPSTLSEDMNSLQQAAQVTTYYQMGARAEQVGYAGLYASLLLMLRARYTSAKPGIAPTSLRLNVIGHSFGCRVVASALQRLIVEINKPTIDAGFSAFVKGLRINLVLLQAAFKKVELDHIGNYDKLSTFNNLRLLVTTSSEDVCLKQWFPKAEEMNNIVHLSFPDLFAQAKPNVAALGSGLESQSPPFSITSGGPTEKTWESFGAVPKIVDVGPGFKCSDVPQNQRLVVADLSELHKYRAQKQLYIGDAFGGSHSDISSSEVYSLIAGFCFNG